MQAVAREVNLSDTAFLYREGHGYALRWFTPVIEVDLCGHATLAAAHVLWETGQVGKDRRIDFFTKSGALSCQRDGAWIEMDFPAEPAVETRDPGGLAQALGIQPVYLGKNRFDYLVHVATETEVRGLRPDMAALRQVQARGVMVTARADDPRYDFVSRFFAPRVGIDEDPVTGSAHCCLAPFWAQMLGKRAMTGLQVSDRGGEVRVVLTAGRVMLGGQAVTVSRRDLMG